MNFRDKLECLSLESFFSLIMYTGKAEAYRNEAPFKCSTLGKAPGLAHEQNIRLEKLLRDKLSSLLLKFENYKEVLKRWAHH